MTAHYESPEEPAYVTNEEIRKRYQDTALVIFKEQESNRERVNYLSYGTSRRTMEYSNNGNQPVIIRRPGELVLRNNSDLSSRMLRIYRKPRESCAVT